MTEVTGVRADPLWWAQVWWVQRVEQVHQAKGWVGSVV